MRTFFEIEAAMLRGEVQYKLHGGDYDKVQDKVTNDEMAALFQHYVDTDTLPPGTQHALFLALLQNAGVVKPRANTPISDELNNGALPSAESED